MSMEKNSVHWWMQIYKIIHFILLSHCDSRVYILYLLFLNMLVLYTFIQILQVFQDYFFSVSPCYKYMYTILACDQCCYNLKQIMEEISCYDNLG